MKSTRLILISAALTMGGATEAQVMYRCGNTFSQVPCGPEAKEMATPNAGSCDDPSRRFTTYCQDKTREHLAGIKKQLDSKLVDTPPPETVITANMETCEKEARRMLKDADSARIKDVRRGGASMQYQDGRTFPGVSYFLTINAKNSYGGYTGEKLWTCTFDAAEKNLIRVREIGPSPR